ncbi:hypothetical protein HK099_005864, partial [Clydaea vesicula]
GHACGHNLIAISGIGAFLLSKLILEKFNDELKKLNFEVILFGSPAEESKGGKIQLIEAGALKGVDFSLMVHPGNVDSVFTPFIARQSFYVEYFGKPAHAAASPWNGVNALDALVLGYQGVSVLR